MAAEHLNWLWSFCTVKSTIGPCLGAVQSPSVQALSSQKKKRSFGFLPSQVSVVLLTNSFPSLALSQPCFPLWLSGLLLMQPDLAIPCNSSEAADLPSLLPELSSLAQGQGCQLLLNSHCCGTWNCRSTHLCLPHPAQSLLWVGGGSSREGWVLLMPWAG